jgi:hypothetical protein
MEVKDSVSNARRGNVIQFSLGGLIAFAVSIVLASGFLFLGLTEVGSAESKGKAGLPDFFRDDAGNVEPKPSGDLPPWGELMTRDIEMERPGEYITEKIETNTVPV